MINDLPGLISSPSALHADGFCLWESGSNIKQLEHLCQNSLCKVNRWCNQSGFEISAYKTAAVFSPTRENQSQSNEFSNPPQSHYVKNINTGESFFKVMGFINHIYCTARF